MWLKDSERNDKKEFGVGMIFVWRCVNVMLCCIDIMNVPSYAFSMMLHVYLQCLRCTLQRNYVLHVLYIYIATLRSEDRWVINGAF